MRVNDEVWDYALAGEGKILLPVGHSASSLLSVTRSKLITNLRNFDGAHLDLHEKVIVLFFGDHYLVDLTGLRMSKCLGSVLLHLSLEHALLLNELVGPRLDDLADDDVVTTDLGSWADEAILVELIVGPVLEALRVLHVWLGYLFVEALPITVCTEEDRPE